MGSPFVLLKHAQLNHTQRASSLDSLAHLNPVESGDNSFNPSILEAEAGGFQDNQGYAGKQCLKKKKPKKQNSSSEGVKGGRDPSMVNLTDTLVWTICGFLYVNCFYI